MSICLDCKTSSRGLCVSHAATDNHTDAADLEIARLKAELEEAHAKRDEWREARNYCGSCGKTMSEAGLCNPCSKRAGNERGELIERKDELAASLRRAEKKLQAAEAELSRLTEENLKLREALEPIRLRSMAGTPDLFAPDGHSWDSYWELVELALSSGDSE